jgi:DNA-binding MarR family transcriptional regulator
VTPARALQISTHRGSARYSLAVDARLLERQADQRDGRRSLLVLTRGGRLQLEAVHGVRRAAFAEAMADWSPAERRRFASLLTRFVERLNRG